MLRKQWLWHKNRMFYLNIGFSWWDCSLRAVWWKGTCATPCRVRKFIYKSDRAPKDIPPLERYRGDWINIYTYKGNSQKWTPSGKWQIGGLCISNIESSESSVLIMLCLRFSRKLKIKNVSLSLVFLTTCLFTFVGASIYKFQYSRHCQILNHLPYFCHY